jgi:hypothetical protein
VGALNDAERLHPPRPEPHGSAAVVRTRVAYSATGQGPADPAGRGDVPVERADVGAVTARRTLDDLAVPEPERDVAAGAVAVAEEDEIAGPVPARGRIGTDAAETWGVYAGVSVLGRSPLAVHCVEVVRPASIPA